MQFSLRAIGGIKATFPFYATISMKKNVQLKVPEAASVAIGVHAEHLIKELHFRALSTRSPICSEKVSDFSHRYLSAMSCGQKIVGDKNDGSLVKKLPFNGQVICKGSHMYGLYRDMRFQRHLIAYDASKQQVEWSVPVASSSHSLELIGNKWLSLCTFHDGQVTLFYPGTGEIEGHFHLSPIDGSYGDFHINHDKIMYRLIKNKDNEYHVIIARVDGSEVFPFFEEKSSMGHLCPLDKYCGLLSKWDKNITIYAPTGAKYEVEHCLRAEAHESQLYMIEKEPLSKYCVLRVRTWPHLGPPLKVEKEIPLPTEYADFGLVCKDQKIVLFFTEEDGMRYPIFIQDRKCFKSPHGIPKTVEKGHYAVDPVSSDVLFFDSSIQKIFRISAEGLQEVGTMYAGIENMAELLMVEGKMFLTSRKGIYV